MACHRTGDDLNADLSNMGPLALCVVVVLREFVAAWKWHKEIARKTEVEGLVGELRPVLGRIQETLAAGRVTVDHLSAEVRDRSGETEKMWRNLYEGLVARHDSHVEREQERIGGLCSKSADALEATETVLSMVLERLESDDGRD